MTTNDTTAVRWEDLTWPEIEGLVRDRPREVALLPVGATEQHGPHLPTGTDTIVARGLCAATSAATGAPVLPAVALGCSYGHGREIPGTISLDTRAPGRPRRRRGALGRRSGMRRVLAVNGHFGNQAALSVAADHLRHDHPDLRFGVLNWWTLTPAITAETMADGEDVHANRAETSLMLALAPEHVRLDQLHDADDEDRTAGLVFRYTASVLSRNGVTGRPSEATAELGAKLLDEVVVDRCAAIRPGLNRGAAAARASASVATDVGPAGGDLVRTVPRRAVLDPSRLRLVRGGGGCDPGLCPPARTPIPSPSPRWSTVATHSSRPGVATSTPTSTPARRRVPRSL